MVYWLGWPRGTPLSQDLHIANHLSQLVDASRLLLLQGTLTARGFWYKTLKIYQETSAKSAKPWKQLIQSRFHGIKWWFTAQIHHDFQDSSPKNRLGPLSQSPRRFRPKSQEQDLLELGPGRTRNPLGSHQFLPFNRNLEVHHAKPNCQRDPVLAWWNLIIWLI